jgi:tRNA A-37 threonylcarbamoyl transferase component Bud32
MNPTKIYNKKSKRWLQVNGTQYNKLLKSGFTVNNNGELSPPNSKKQVKVLEDIEKDIEEDIRKNDKKEIKKDISKDINNDISKKSKKVDKIIKNDISDKHIIPVSFLISYLSPKDLLALYLSNKDIEIELNTVKSMTILNQRLKTHAKTFPEWYKLYSISKIDNQMAYLYEMENTRFVNEEKINKIIQSKDDISVTMINILFDWLYEVRKKLALQFITYCYTCTLFMIYLSHSDFKRDELRLYACVIMHYSTLLVENYAPDESDWVYITGKEFTLEQFHQAQIKVLNTLNGQLIYPSPILFFNARPEGNEEPTDNDNILVLIALNSFVPSLATLKPSLITETCKYLITGKYQIYTMQEINYVCKIIISNLNKLNKSNLKTLQPRAELILSYIKYTCGEESVLSPLQPLKYNEFWHLGKIEKGEVLGQGAYGQVYKIKRNQCGKDYVIKTTNDESNIPEAIQEIALLTLLKDQDHIIKLCGFDYKEVQVNMVLPLMNGSLKTVRLDRNYYKKYFKQIIEGIYECHMKDVIHRDIKIENIVYDQSNDSVNIIDFGLSVPFQSRRRLRDDHLVNTFHYRPPECIMFHNYTYTNNVDIWAAGCVMYYMMTGTYIMTNFTEQGGLDDIFKLLGTPTDETWPGYSNLNKLYNIPIYPEQINELKVKLAPYSNLILDCLTVYPGNRPSATQILEKYF